MKKIAFAIAIFGTVLSPVLCTGPAHAQATRTWVSGVGDDANPCSRTAPCKTLAGAISKTAASGEIDCLDPGGFGDLTITKAITIDCDETLGGVLAEGTNGIVVNTATTDTVTLKGLDMEGLRSGISGINFIGGGVLHVYKVHIRNFRGGSGINFAPNTGIAQLDLADSYITDNGNSATTGGILIKPTGSASAKVIINRTTVTNNTVGIRADSSSTTGTIHGVVYATIVSGSTNNGITANSAGKNTALLVDHAAVLANNVGLVADGAGASLLVTNTDVTANNTGLTPISPGSISSYKNNYVNGNITSNGSFSAAITPE